MQCADPKSSTQWLHFVLILRPRMRAPWRAYITADFAEETKAAALLEADWPLDAEADY